MRHTPIRVNGTRTEHDVALAEALSPARVLGVAIGCLVLEQLLLAFWWQPAHGWVALVVAPVLAVVLPLVLLCRALGSSFAAGIQWRRPAWRPAVGSLLVALGTLAPAYGASRALEPWLDPPADLVEMYAGLMPTGPLAFVGGIVAIVVAAPLAEEILFRGLVQPGLARVVPVPLAVAASAAAFGAAHGSLWLMVPVTVLGIALGAIAWWTRGIACAWIAHAAFNALGFAELCITRDPSADAVAHVATRPAPAVALCFVLMLGCWVLVRSGRDAAAVTLDPDEQFAAGADPSATSSDPPVAGSNRSAAGSDRSADAADPTARREDHL
jgi:membrane protease YdiL (CAAX protease family)